MKSKPHGIVAANFEKERHCSGTFLITATPMTAQTKKILVVDDEKNLREVLRIELTAAGAEVTEAENGIQALERIEREEFDVMLLDLNMPVLGGIDVLKKMKPFELSVEVVVLTAHATVSTAVDAMKLGAYDFLTKPFHLEELIQVIDKAVEKKKLRNENLLLKTQVRRQTDLPLIIGTSSAVQDLLEAAGKVAQSGLPVLITGESGVGKELIAATVHRGSSRADGPFVPINCGALPETMIESELFGYEKGAFTGAASRKLGLLEVANEGTLFLDEIGDMPLALQVKLLRVLETGRFFRLGGTREQNVDVRVLAATNKDLQAEIPKKTFRQDLYYRIAALTLHSPPLRERAEDIPALIEHFIKDDPEFRNKAFSQEAISVLSGYSWPGNVRELRNVVHRALLLSPGRVIMPTDLPADLHARPAARMSPLDVVEREHILRVLDEVKGHRGRAAEVLGIDPKTLYRKLAGYGVPDR